MGVSYGKDAPDETAYSSEDTALCKEAETDVRERIPNSAEDTDFARALFHSNAEEHVD